jgi:hypothetical protein
MKALAIATCYECKCYDNLLNGQDVCCHPEFDGPEFHGERTIESGIELPPIWCPLPEMPEEE